MICTSLGRGGGLVVARCQLRHPGVTRMPDEGAAKGVEELAHEGCMCCSCCFLCVDGGPDQVDREGRAQVRRGVRIRPFDGREDLRLLPARQSGGAVRQAHVPVEHGLDGLQV